MALLDKTIKQRKWWQDGGSVARYEEVLKTMNNDAVRLSVKVSSNQDYSYAKLEVYSKERLEWSKVHIIDGTVVNQMSDANQLHDFRYGFKGGGTKTEPTAIPPDKLFKQIVEELKDMAKRILP